MNSDSDADFYVAALAQFLFQRSRRSLLHMKKEKTFGTSRGIFVLLLKLHHPRCYTYLLSQLLLFRVLQFVTQIRFLTKIRRAIDAALA